MILLIVTILAIYPATLAIKIVLKKYHTRKYGPFKFTSPKKINFNPPRIKENILVPNPFKNWPRNLTCFCGSGIKFKKCCDHKIYDRVNPSLAESYKSDYKKALKFVQDLKMNQDL